MKKTVLCGAVVSLSLIPAWSQWGDFRKARAQGQFTACKSNLKNLGTALEMYSTDYSGRYPKSFDVLTRPSQYGPYLKTIPTCPAAGADTYTSTYYMTASKRTENGKMVGRDFYSFYCRGHHHRDAGAAKNLPAFNSERGLVDR